LIFMSNFRLLFAVLFCLLTPLHASAYGQSAQSHHRVFSQKTNARQKLVVPRVIPTTTNPTINVANAGSRIIANTSFEGQANNGMLCETVMRGWLTSHPVSGIEGCRVFEVWSTSSAWDSLIGIGAPQGSYYIELNAYSVSMAYQPICMVGGESFDFEFYHHVRSWSDTNTIEFRFGIPSGLTAGSKAADSYSRQVVRGATVQGASGSTATASVTSYTGTTGAAYAVQTAPLKNWVKYSGTHTISADFGGVRNLGFFGILPAGSSANLIDAISIGLDPIFDMGGSVDQSAGEQTTPNAIKIRINGRVAAGTKIALRRNAANPGDAVSDTDFTLGTVSAGANGTATVTHTAGSDLWLIDVPAGSYDGGKVAANNQSGLTIPVNYVYDQVSEGTEFAYFELAAPGENGSSDSTTWQYAAPTCDGSFKNDGVVYTITNVDPTNTPTHTNTATFTPTRTFTNTATHTPTLTFTKTATATNTATNTATETPTQTATYTATSTPTSTPTATFTATATATPTGQYIVFATPEDRIEDGPNIVLTATSSVGLPVRYSSSTPSICTVTTSGTVTLLLPGDCTIVASAPSGTVGGVSYAAAPDVSRTFKIKTKQVITFTAPSERIYTAPDFGLTASATSALPVTYTTSTSAICTVSPSGTVHLVAPGTCSITATQSGGLSGSATYAPAPPVTTSFLVKAVPQTITFAPPGEKLAYEGSFDLAGTTTSGLELVYTSSTPSVCTVSGKKVIFVSVGKCSITATQSGGTKAGTIYAAAAAQTRDFFFTDYTATPTLTPSNTRTFTPTNTPTPVPFMMKKGAVGASFVLGLLQNDTLVTWGMNREYQANIAPCCGSGIQDIAVGTNFALVLKGGRVYGWGANTRGQLKFPVQVSKDITAIAAGGAHGLALSKKGLVSAWGDNSFKQAQVPKGLKGIVQLAGGATHTLAIKSDGSVVAWGGNTSGQTNIPLGLKTVVQVAAGLDHSLALKKDGTVVAWGGNTFGQATVPASTADMKQVSAGTQFSLAVRNDGTVFTWGRNDFNQITILPEYTNIYSVAAGYANTILGLRNGRIVVLGAQTDGIDVSRTPTKTATRTP
jgi:hypothetical protein